MDKLRILCLHGYRQNEQTFRERTGALRKLLKSTADFVFISAPHVIPEEENLKRPPEQRERGWWFSRPERSYNALDETDISTGYEESLELVVHVIINKGPFDGILGFSQGAAFLSLLCQLQQDNSKLFGSGGFKFAIFVSGFQSLVKPHKSHYKAAISLPSFHMIGTGDQVIPVLSSETLSQHFTSSVIYLHHGGHYIPASTELREQMKLFLSQFT
ncbi:esterase OVCA2-like [Dysidea avara]|uniref:esterase OVCA2-like n=1 Tax=Dysidea avara TaxID=196820 RepID=UPI00331CA49A